MIGRISSSSSVHVIATRLALRWKRLVEGGIVTRVVMARWWWWLSLLGAPVRVPIRPPWVPVWSHWCSASTILVLEVGRIVCRVNSIGRSSLVIGSRTPVGMRWLRIVHCHILLVIRCPLWVSWHGIVCRVLATTLIMLTLKIMWRTLRTLVLLMERALGALVLLMVELLLGHRVKRLTPGSPLARIG